MDRLIKRLYAFERPLKSACVAVSVIFIGLFSARVEVYFLSLLCGLTFIAVLTLRCFSYVRDSLVIHKGVKLLFFKFYEVNLEGYKERQEDN